MSTLALTIQSDLAGLGELTQDSSADAEGLRALANYLEACATGCAEARIELQTSASDPVAASGTLTLVSVIATDAITIGTTTFTFTSTPTLATHVEVDGADDDADAAALAAAINAHSTVNKIVAATVADNVVTITAMQKGVVGNFIPLSSADATITASGSFLEGGTGGATTAAKIYRCGL